MTSLDTIVAVELGTCKICVLVAEADESEGLKVIGVGQSPSHGIRKGEVTDPTMAINDLEQALHDAEESSGFDITRAYLGITGSHIRGTTNRGLHPIRNREKGVTNRDIEIVMKNARSFELDENYNRLHSIQQNFRVDDIENIKNPLGYRGSNLTVEMHLIEGAYNRIENSIQIVRENNVDVQEVAFNGLATALACLGNREKEHGALVIDIGAGSTDFLLYSGGRVRHSGVIPVGGDHVHAVRLHQEDFLQGAAGPVVDLDVDQHLLAVDVVASPQGVLFLVGVGHGRAQDAADLVAAPV